MPPERDEDPEMKLQREGLAAPASSQTVGMGGYAGSPAAPSAGVPVAQRSARPRALLIGLIVVLLLILAGAAAGMLLG